MSESNIHISSPDAYIVVFPFIQEKTYLGSTYDSSTMETRLLMISKDIISISTSKGKGASGSWHATLGSSQNYKAALHPGCWVMIYINDFPYDKYTDGSSENSGLKMIGTIRSLRCIENTDESGTRTIRYEISGDDFHSVFQSNIYINSLLRIGQNTASAFAKNWIIFEKLLMAENGLSPDTMSTELLDAVLGADLSESTKLEYSGDPNGKTNAKIGGPIGVPVEMTRRFGTPTVVFNSILKRCIGKLLGSVTPQPSVGEQYTLWGLLKAYSHSLINEIYTDLIVHEGKIVPGIVHRPIPFSTNGIHGGLKITQEVRDLQLYVSKKIEENAIISLNYGKSDAERFNLFLIGSNFSHNIAFTALNQNDVTGLDMASIGDSNSIARFGLRPYISASDYVAMSDDILKINELVRDIWSTGHLFENGQVTIVGCHEHISVGTNIEFTERKWIAHVEGVSHSFHASGSGHKSFFTTISFVRLQTKDGQPIDMVEKGGRDSDPGSTHSEGGEK